MLNNLNPLPRMDHTGECKPSPYGHAADLEAGIRLTQGRIGRLTPKTWRRGLPADPLEP